MSNDITITPKVESLLLRLLKDAEPWGDASAALAAGATLSATLLQERDRNVALFYSPPVPHHPGLWRLRLHDLTGECDIVADDQIQDSDGETVGETVVVPTGVFSVEDPVSIANGRLMAAAPKLLKVVQQCKDIVNHRPHGVSAEHACKAVFDLCEATLSAIAERSM